MMSEYHGAPAWLDSALEQGNLLLTAAFAVEMACKHLGLGVAGYWADAFNRFDGAIVIISVHSERERERERE